MPATSRTAGRSNADTPSTGKIASISARYPSASARSAAVIGGGDGRVEFATFTRRAAGELTERLACLRGPGEPLPLADTLHALALALWAMRRGQPPVLLSEDAARKLFVESLPDSLGKPEREALFRRHSLAREQG